MSPRVRRRTLLGLAGGAALGALVPPGLARAAPLAEGDVARLRDLQQIRVPIDLELPQGFYFGGIAYQLCVGSAGDVMAVAGDPDAYTTILAMTSEARLLERRGRTMRVRLRQGEGVASVGYVLLLRREGQGLLRFWLDPSEPHDLDDGWGFLRAEPWPRPLWPDAYAPAKHVSLLTWGWLLCIGSDVLRRRYAESIRTGAMETPRLLAMGVHRRLVRRTLAATPGGR